MEARLRWFLFIAITFTFGLMGWWLNDSWQFMSEEGAFLSSRALIAGRGDPVSLENIGLVYPPLAFYMAVPLTWLWIFHPAVWLSAIWAGGFTFWLMREFTQFPFREKWLGFVALLLPLQPGVFHSAATGGTLIVFMTIFTVGLFLTARFALDQEVLETARIRGSMSAWINSAEYMNERVRYLWSAALCFGLAGFCRFDLLLGLAVLLPMTPLLLIPSDRGDFWKIITLSLLLFLPLIATQFIWGYLTWVFTGDFFYALKHPSTYFRQVSSELLTHPLLLGLQGKPLESIGYVGVSMFISFPIFAYLLIRIRNFAVTILFLTPVVVEGLGAAYGMSVMNRSYLSFAGILSIVLFLLCMIYRRFTRLESYLVPVALMVCTFFSWQYFSQSPFSEERIWKQMIEGDHASVRRFLPERELAEHIEAGGFSEGGVLLDEQQAYAMITLSNHPRQFTLPYQKRYVVALQNPALIVEAVGFRVPSIAPGTRDRVSERWALLDNRSTGAFELEQEFGPWRFYRRTLGATPEQITATR